ncbi:TRAP transporter, DctM subunit [Roseovarius litoreus]|uniref:TRAP transporter large permease protein n=1 Tax=Roseovarius litoreus TaxID=1155722 RepID=A0A1M7LM19_9RHOB|nr:TRAP transporter large permease [Roseovarius litoreus]SHM79188.1 TRAP transporter, DctM subunit [Roseovarius litoreus]
MLVSDLTVGWSGIGVVLGLMVLRVPIGVTLVLVSLAGLAIMIGPESGLAMITAVPYNFVGDWSLSAIPMFLLMGYLAANGGLTSGLFDFMKLALGRVHGGLAHASVGACALFAAASGSTFATGAAMSRIAVPEMLKAGYHPGLATGVVAASGTLGSLIPPSILMILFGIFANQSIGQLFVAGILPGILSALIYMGMIWLRARMNPELAPRSEIPFSVQRFGSALLDVWPLPVLIFSIMTGIFFGIFSPTEAGALGASLALLIVFIRGNLNWRILTNSIRETVESTASIFIIAVGSLMFSRMLTISGVPDAISTAFTDTITSPIQMLLVIAVVYIVLGMFIDAIGLMLITLPIFLPTLQEMNVDLIWFGILTIKMLEIGLITPPIGLNVFVIYSALDRKIPLTTIFKGVFWFIAMDVLTLAILIAFPRITLFLPALASGN